MIPTSDKEKQQIERVKHLILSEVNVKEIKYLSLQNNVLQKSIKANFKTLGPKYGKMMKEIANKIAQFNQNDIAKIENEGEYRLDINGEDIIILNSDVEITTKDIEGWLVANEGNLTVALDITITDDLKKEAIAREVVNRIQNIRKDSNFEVTDNIIVEIEKEEMLEKAINQFHDYICNETLTKELTLKDKIENPTTKIDVIEGKELDINIKVKK